MLRRGTPWYPPMLVGTNRPGLTTSRGTCVGWDSPAILLVSRRREVRTKIASVRSFFGLNPDSHLGVAIEVTGEDTLSQIPKMAG
jgi:hypothetical protein